VVGGIARAFEAGATVDGNQQMIVVDYVTKGRFPLIPAVYQTKNYKEK